MWHIFNDTAHAKEKNTYGGYIGLNKSDHPCIRDGEERDIGRTE
jgi:hypothetical protein